MLQVVALGRRNGYEEPRAGPRQNQIVPLNSIFAGTAHKPFDLLAMAVFVLRQTHGIAVDGLLASTGCCGEHCAATSRQPAIRNRSSNFNLCEANARD